MVYLPSASVHGAAAVFAAATVLASVLGASVPAAAKAV